MMKKLFVALSVIAIIGCSSVPENPERSYEGYVKVVYLDGCEYYKSWISGGYTFTHKGNCRYCSERRKKEIEEVIKNGNY